MIAIGCDHAGYTLKLELCAFLDAQKISYQDFGCDGSPCNYPVIAETVCQQITDGTCDRGILICGTGIGMSMAANKIKGIRAAVCGDVFSAKYTRLHNDANVLCLGARVLGGGLAIEIADIFLRTQFEGGRHQLRVDMIRALEEK